MGGGRLHTAARATQTCGAPLAALLAAPRRHTRIAEDVAQPDRASLFNGTNGGHAVARVRAGARVAPVRQSHGPHTTCATARLWRPLYPHNALVDLAAPSERTPGPMAVPVSAAGMRAAVVWHTHLVSTCEGRGDSAYARGGVAGAHQHRSVGVGRWSPLNGNTPGWHVGRSMRGRHRAPATQMVVRGAYARNACLCSRNTSRGSLHTAHPLRPRPPITAATQPCVAKPVVARPCSPHMAATAPRGKHIT